MHMHSHSLTSSLCYTLYKFVYARVFVYKRDNGILYRDTLDRKIPRQ